MSIQQPTAPDPAANNYFEQRIGVARSKIIDEMSKILKDNIDTPIHEWVAKHLETHARWKTDLNSSPDRVKEIFKALFSKTFAFFKENSKEHVMLIFTRMDLVNGKGSAGAFLGTLTLPQAKLMYEGEQEAALKIQKAFRAFRQQKLEQAAA